MKAALLLCALTLPPLAGTLVAFYLRPALTRLLADLCGTPVRAEVWSRITQLFLILGPTALALTGAGNWRTMEDGLDVLRAVGGTAINALLAVLLALAWVLWRQVPRAGSEGEPRP